MASQGPLYATNYAEGPTGVAWTNPASVMAQDDSRATVLLSGLVSSRTISLTGFGFNIPADATITGIKVEATGYSIKTYGNYVQQRFRLIKVDGSGGGSYWISLYNAAGDYVSSCGNSTFLWGTTWKPGDINDSGFGIQYTVENFNAGDVNEARVNSVALTVYYTVAGYQHKVCSTLAANLGELSDVPTANISKISGV